MRRASRRRSGSYFINLGILATLRPVSLAHLLLPGNSYLNPSALGAVLAVQNVLDFLADFG